MSPVTITVAAPLVPYLRRGVKRELSATLALLAFQVDTVLDHQTYYDAFARLDQARALFDTVGVLDDPAQGDLDVDLDRWPRLVLRALESEYDAEVRRLQDYAAEGVAQGLAISLDELPALGRLVADIRERVGAPSRPGRRGTLRALALRKIRNLRREA